MLQICDFVDFHSKIHHDLNINKTKINFVKEFISNVITQGLLLIPFIQFLKYLDMRVIIMWAFAYATIHNINFSFINPSVHRDHHKYNNTNYGLDIYDIIFGTKYDWDDIENYNHDSINIVVLTAIIIYFAG
jgi:sterol desaturase/sphingolipid hydroxylase (fatty acid hydroxylase superfamily)